jgi:gliding motility-associated transport system ATP-binding protein
MIEAEQLSRSYGDFRAVDGVSFEIQRGEVVGLLGHNGAGKTTIMKMLTGSLEPSAGRITLDREDLAEHRQAAQRRIGYLAENCPLYPEMTVIDFLEYHAGLHGIPDHKRLAAVRSAIARTELEPKAADVIATLSRGYRQRVGVAQAILHEPDILILDEPTNGLDPTQIQHMRSLIHELAQNATVLLSTHILQEVEAVCGRVLIIHSGRLALDSRLADLNVTHRLLVTADGSPDQVQPVLGGVEGVSAVRHVEAVDGVHRYALDTADPSAAAPQVARAVMDGGLRLFGLEPERRDLETVFGEINSQRSEEAAHA